MSSGHGKRRKVHEEEHEEEGGSERWLVTYADMLTLLMVLFIVLFASSNIDKKKYAGLQKSLSKAFNNGSPATAGGQGILSGGTVQTNQGGMQNGNPIGPGDTSGAITADAALGQISQNVAKDLKSKGLQNDAAQSRDGQGLTITLVTDKVLFDSGSATLLPEGVKIIDAIAPALRNTGGRGISVNGYTDSQPIHGAISNNLTLSLDRAGSVADQLISNGVSESTMHAQGYGATVPIADNSTDAGRVKNRRVVIVVAALPASATASASAVPAAASTAQAKTASVVTSTAPSTTPSAVKLAKGGAAAGVLTAPPAASVVISSVPTATFTLPPTLTSPASPAGTASSTGRTR